MFLLIYVDDIIITSSLQEAVAALLEDLRAKFSPKDLRPLHYFLGIEVKQERDGLHLSQGKYAADILKHAGMTHCKSVTTLLAVSEKLSVHTREPLNAEDSAKYMSIVGAIAICDTHSFGHSILSKQSVLVSSHADH
jgi:hypothetical protein